MGNPIRRGKGKAASVAKSPDYSNSSDISPKSIPKSKNMTKTALAAAMHTSVKITAPVNEGISHAEVKKVAPQKLRFKSTATGTLPETGHFQPHHWEERTKQLVVQAKALSATTPSFIPVQVNKTEKPAGAVTFGSQKPPVKNVKKQGQTSASGTARHGKNKSKPTSKSQPSAGVAKLQDLIKEFPPYNPAHHAKHLSAGSIISHTSSSAVSPRTFITTPAPRVTRERYVRINENNKDLLIHAAGFTRNKVRCVEIMSANGDLHWQPLPGFNPSPLNFLTEMADKEEAAKYDFWTNNEVQIIVDLRSVSMDSIETKNDDKEDAKGKAKEVAVIEPPTVIDQIAKLGMDFYKYAVNITVDIIFPPPREGSVAPNRPQNISNKQGKWVYPTFDIAIHTAGFKIIEQLVAKLDNCVGMQHLSVIIHNLNASTTCPFTLEQLYYALPFYDMCFEQWQLKWQGNYMSEPVDVGHFPIILLDKERNKWLWAKKKAVKDAEITAGKERERVNNMVFVTKSAAPEWNVPATSLPEPFPRSKDPPAKKKQLKTKGLEKKGSEVVRGEVDSWMCGRRFI